MISGFGGGLQARCEVSVTMQIDEGCVGIANMLALRDFCFVVIGVGIAHDCLAFAL
jgi:hypothetical protein